MSDHPRHGSSPQYPPKVAYDDEEALPQWEPPAPPDMEPPVESLSRDTSRSIMGWLFALVAVLAAGAAYVVLVP